MKFRLRSRPVTTPPVGRVSDLVLSDRALEGVAWMRVAYQFLWPNTFSGPGRHGGTWAGLREDPKTGAWLEADGVWTLREADAYWLLRRTRDAWRDEHKPLRFDVIAERDTLTATPRIVVADWGNQDPCNPTQGR